MLHGEDLRQFLSDQLGGKRIGTITDDGGRAFCAQLRCQLLTCSQGFKAHAVPLAATLFHQHENTVHIALTSNFSFSTSLAATSAGVPVSISVFFCFSGR